MFLNALFYFCFVEWTILEKEQSFKKIIQTEDLFQLKL